MMRKYALAGAAALAFSGVAQAAPVPTITFTNGVYSIPSFTTAQVFEDFEGGTTGTAYNPLTQKQTNNNPYVEAVTTGGTTSATILTGNVPGQGFNPDGDTNKYLSIEANSSLNVAFGTAGVRFFSFVFGTLDSYNSLVLGFSDGTAQTFTGQQIVGGPAPTSPTPFTSGETGRVSYNVSAGPTITSATFASTPFGSFEIDGLAAAVPEPAMWAMMIMGFGLAGAALRTRRRSVTFSRA